ncbi:MAG: NERD domain-containing protein [Desulfobulbaceae bacterium]|nr:NERD domain-containing protein [Desulfobulbaceae bacterium]
MGLHFGQLLPYLLAFGASLTPLVPFLVWSYWRRLVHRSRPRPEKLLSGPGDSLRQLIAELDWSIAAATLWLVAIPVAAIGVFLAPKLVGIAPLERLEQLTMAGLPILLLLFPLFSLIARCRERAVYRLGLDAQLLAGREINLLLREGFHVFHDVPGSSGNIDHVVVGLSGVFAVKSLGRPVPDMGSGLIDAKVICDGENLFFPPGNTRETEAVKQARRQAITLERWLGEVLDRSVQVKPALAVPGWFVEKRRPDDLTLLYGQASHYARILRGPTVLSPELVGEIVGFLDARCRGITDPAGADAVAVGVKNSC